MKYLGAVRLSSFEEIKEEISAALPKTEAGLGSVMFDLNLCEASFMAESHQTC